MGAHAGWQRLAVLATVGALLLTLLTPAAPTEAAVINVNSLADPSPATGSCPATCTLRNAIAAATPGDTIQFSVTGTILLNAKLVLSKNVVIEGPGAANLVVDGQTAHSVFEVLSDVQATLRGITIQRGAGEIAGGVSSLNGHLTLTQVVVQNNRGATSGGVYIAYGSLNITNSTITSNLADLGQTAGQGGGIGGARTSVTISGSTISNNSAGFGQGGGLSMDTATVVLSQSTVSGNTANDGGGIWIDEASLTVTNSTISGNTALSLGGGISIDSDASVDLLHATLSGNAASSGGGIYSNGSIRSRNSIVVSSAVGGNCALGPHGTFTSQGNNLSDTTACFAGGAQADLVSAQPLLGPLALNSPGATKTHALLYGSPAIDGVTFNPTDCASTVVSDQRGANRPQTWAAARCDIGAFELAANTAPTISNPGAQIVDEDGPLPTLLVTIGDNETPNSLTVTGSSSNPALLPNANIGVSNSGLLRSVTLTPLANQSGSATVTLAVNDGYATATTAFTLNVTAVNDLPVAVNDAYAVTSPQSLTVAAGTGVLANDTDVEGASLTASLTQGPAHGALSLSPNGSFTYQPTASFAGVDTFTYRASDGSASSATTATVSITVSPTACSPRPAVRPQLAAGGRKLLVNVVSSPVAAQQPSILRELRFGVFQNARVTVSGQTVASGQIYTVPGAVTSIDFTVERITPGQPTTVPLTVVDDCGAWQTLVGGGATAGF